MGSECCAVNCSQGTAEYKLNIKSVCVFKATVSALPWLFLELSAVSLESPTA